jgi:hypothetical protein
MSCSWHKLLLAASVGVLAVGCGTTHGTVRDEQATNDAFAQIQVREAEIAAAQRRIDALGSAQDEQACRERCGASDTACTASRALCETAHGLSDADALARCERGREACAHDRAAAADASCACPVKLE